MVIRLEAKNLYKKNKEILQIVKNTRPVRWEYIICCTNHYLLFQAQKISVDGFHLDFGECIQCNKTLRAKESVMHPPEQNFIDLLKHRIEISWRMTIRNFSSMILVKRVCNERFADSLKVCCPSEPHYLLKCHFCRWITYEIKWGEVKKSSSLNNYVRWEIRSKNICSIPLAALQSISLAATPGGLCQLLSNPLTC